jgi:hypothetical protein
VNDIGSVYILSASLCCLSVVSSRTPRNSSSSVPFKPFDLFQKCSKCFSDQFEKYTYLRIIFCDPPPCGANFNLDSQFLSPAL